MENIYKIKIRANPDPRWLYPSERRYSASTVLGLGVVHLALSGMALLLACITLTAPELHKLDYVIGSRNQNKSATGNLLNLTIPGEYTKTDSNTYLTVAPCVMSLGSLAAGLTSFLAWKRWYIDHNIKWFFFMSVISTTTSTYCLVTVGILVIILNEHLSNKSSPSSKYILIINILITSIMEWLWSILSTKVSFMGMRNNYPDDIVISKPRGKVQVNTVQKGNKKSALVAPYILNHFPITGKMSKYLPKRTSNNLPKAESNSEYQERVNKFLSANVDSNSIL